MINKKNIVPINWSKEAMLCLQYMDFLNGHKRSTGKKNLSKFVSRLVVEYIAIRYPLVEREIKERVTKLQLVEIQNERNELDKRIQDLAIQLSGLKEAKRNEK